MGQRETGIGLNPGAKRGLHISLDEVGADQPLLCANASAQGDAVTSNNRSRVHQARNHDGDPCAAIYLLLRKARLLIPWPQVRVLAGPSFQNTQSHPACAGYCLCNQAHDDYPSQSHDNGNRDHRQGGQHQVILEMCRFSQSHK